MELVRSSLCPDTDLESFVLANVTDPDPLPVALRPAPAPSLSA